MRPPRDEDAGWVAELVSRHTPEPFPVERVLEAWHAPGIDAERDLRIEDDAAAFVDPDGERAWLRLAGRPSPGLVAWAIERARESGATRLLAGEWAGAPALAQLEHAGFHRRGESVRMRIELAGEQVAPRWPKGISVRGYRDGDAEAVYRVHLETFQDMTEPMRASFEEWSHWFLAAPLFEPATWFLAEDVAELVGISLCHPAEEENVAMVGILGVRAPWRRRGLGRALLEHSFRELGRRGFRAVTLGAEASSPTGADQLYERAGMRVTHRRLRYEKVLA